MSSRTLGDRLRVLDAGSVPPDGPDVPRGSRADEDPRRRFMVDVRRTAMPAMTTLQWDAITAHNDPPRWFTVGSTPVRIAGGNGEPVTAQSLTMDMLRGISARTAYWHKFTERDGEQEQFPLEPVIRDMLADPAPPLPHLARIVTAPVCGPDGAIAYEPGYCQQTGNYYAASCPVARPSNDPSASEIDTAKTLLLDDFLGDFPFTGEAERAHALSLILNPFLRDLVEGPTPLYLIEAPSAGTGKGLLAHMAMLPALGPDRLVLVPPTAAEEETRKRLTAALMDLPEALLLDNVSKSLDSPALAAALTTTLWTDRMLGRSETRSLRVRATWIATANNPTMSREIARRIVRIRLDAKAERPEERAIFRHRRLARWAADHRGELISAALTLVQAWTSAGCPMSEHVLGSFDTWAQVHGGVLDVAGVPGFLENRKNTSGHATGEEAAMAALVPLWWEKHRDAVVKSGDLYDIAYTIDEFPMGKSSSEKGMKQSFGWTLSRFTDRVFGAYRITYVDVATNGHHYRLEPVGTGPP